MSMEKRYNILHLTVDNKFFESVSKNFDSSSYYYNTYVLPGVEANGPFQFIKSVEKITPCETTTQFENIIKRTDFDVVYLHGLRSHWYPYIKRIKSDTPVIWWSWGMDIYESWGLVPPYLKYNIYKMETERYVKYSIGLRWQSILKKLIYFFTFPYTYYVKKSILGHITHIRPVLPIEYSFLPHNGAWKHIQQLPEANRVHIEELRVFDYSGKVMIGNSATISNNHIDIFNKLESSIKGTFDYFVPVSYGVKFYSDYIYNRYNGTHSYGNVSVLRNFMPYEQYTSLLDTCTHAIYGVIRQQAIGNIYMCLRKGIKLFLYKDSIVYKQLHDIDGYVIFTIDDNLSEYHLTHPLTNEEATHNFNRYNVLSESHKPLMDLILDVIEENKR